MNRMGKLDPRTMKRSVYGSLGRSSSSVIAGPAIGFDNAVISLGRRERMILTTDPVSIIPAVGMEASAWLSVHLIASDYATSGRRPQFATFSFNVPPEIPEASAERYLKSIGHECKRLGVSIVAGHTGSYPGGGLTVIGAGTMFGFSVEGEYVLPSMARVGDSILMTKGSAIEATASLALSFPRFTEERVGRGLASRAKAMLTKCSVVEDALTASTLGLGRSGVTSMHDATEGGVIGGLEEMASASGRSYLIDRDSILVPPECEATCRAFGLDPATTLSEGTLLLTCNPRIVSDLVGELEKKGIAACEIGRVGRGEGLWIREGSRNRRARLANDGYWRAYEAGVKSRLK